MSRSKTPNPNQNGSYDQNLLGDAPQATRAQLQGGYDVDLLDDQPQRSQSVRSPATPGVPSSGVPPPIPTVTPAIPENISKEKFASAESGGVYTPAAKRPFWRTPKGIIILVVVAIVIIIAAVVGGVVGANNNKKPNDNTSTPAIFPTTTTSNTTNVSSKIPSVGGGSPTSGAAPTETLGTSDSGGSTGSSGSNNITTVIHT